MRKRNEKKRKSKRNSPLPERENSRMDALTKIAEEPEEVVT